MAVDDHGLEVLKKSGEEITPGSKANYYIKVNDSINKVVLEQILSALGGSINVTFTLDGPSVNGGVSITDTASELKVGASRLEGRIVVSIQPLDGVVYFGFSNGVTASNGTKVFKGQYFSLEAGESEEVWLIAESGETVNVRISERR